MIVERPYWKHRMYSIGPLGGDMAGQGACKAVCQLQFISFGLPRSFVWLDRADEEGLRSYIDLLGAGRKAEASALEATGVVTEIRYDPEDLRGTIRVDAESFFSALALRGHVDLPLVERVVFLKQGNLITPRDYLTCLGTYSGHPEWFPEPHRAVIAQRGDIEHLNPSGSMYAEVPQPDEEEDDGTPPAETELSRIPRDRYFELITRAVPKRGAPFYVRRIARYDGGLIWSGTSYNQYGKWTESFRDNGQMLAYGIAV